jgi:broad specificity phosphatase PhoE
MRNISLHIGFISPRFAGTEAFHLKQKNEPLCSSGHELNIFISHANAVAANDHDDGMFGKKTMTELWLVRHGQTDWNLSGRWQGQTPDAPGLNNLGQAQAQAVLAQLKNVHLSAVYTSDLLRAKQTAELIAKPLGLTIALEPRLREINLGIWEGLLSTDIEAQYPHELDERKQNPFHACAPGGESPQEVADRVLAAVDEIARKFPDDSILIVSHGVSLALIICQAERFPMEEVYDHIPDNAQPYCVQWLR